MTLVLPQLNLSDGASPEVGQRLKELYSMDALDCASDERFDKYAELLATSFLDAPIASVVLVDRDELVIRASYGHSFVETSPESSFTAQAMQQSRLLTVEDTLKDPRFQSHPMVASEPFVRSYAGAVIRGPQGQPLGTLSVMDTVARSFSDNEQRVLLQITRILENELQNRARVAQLRHRIHEQILLDPFTQLPTEALFNARLTQCIEADSPNPTLIALIRLERFDAIHSAVGKPGAVYLVRNAADRLESALGNACLIGLVRDDTLAVAFAIEDAGHVPSSIEMLTSCFDEPFRLGEHVLAQNVTIGTAMYPADGTDGGRLLKRARTALSSMPPSDVSRAAQHEGELGKAAGRQSEIESALRNALLNDELSLAYQPKINIRKRRLVGAEALLRWNTERLGQVPPSVFVPIAEESGLIVELGDWVLENAIRQMAEWVEKGLECPQVSVNVSGIQLRQPEFCQRVQHLLIDYSIAGSRLNLEVTEGTLIENIEEAVNVMSQLRALNVSISIDDFGKGFCSLSYLARMPVQVLKIDRSFVEGIPGDESNMTLVRSIVAMGHALGLQVVAEGVENVEQLATLTQAGCDHVQGFLIGRPLESRDFESAFLGRNKKQQ